MDQLLTLDQAALQIAITAHDQPPPERRPFFFLVGAGVSKPPVPLAGEIIEECKQRALQENPAITEPAGMTAMDRYSFWIKMAFTAPQPQQRYIRKLIENKYISRANLRLAHLLLDKAIANLVVTPNFDDLLSRALQLFVQPHIVCDHPATVGRINPENVNDVQILHVHGTYWFYDLKNTVMDIKETGESRRLQRALDHVLFATAPLVIGYSGWENDIIMTSLKRRLVDDPDPLPNNLYWFCYQHEVVESLPNWLRVHPQVYFVVPEKRAADTPSLKDGAPSSAEQAQLDVQGQTKLIDQAEQNGNKYTLSAQQVLDKLIEKSKPKAPGLLNDPLGFLSNYLEKSLVGDDCTAKPDAVDRAKQADVYYIDSVVRRIKLAKSVYEDQLQQAETSVAAVLDALRRAQYREAIERGRQIPIKPLEPSLLLELVDAMWSAAIGLNDNSAEEFAAYRLVVTCGDALASEGALDDALQSKVAKALYNQGVMTKDDNEAAIRIYNQVLERYANKSGPIYEQLTASTLVTLGVLQGESGEFKRATEYYAEVIRRFSDARNEKIRRQVAKAHNNTGFILLCEAKTIWQQSGQAAAQAKLAEALAEIQAALDYNPQHTIAMGNHGYITFLRGDESGATSILTKAISLDGERLRQFELEDSLINEIPEIDAKFRNLVNAITCPAPTEAA